MSSAMMTTASPVAAASQTKALSSLQKNVQIGRPAAFPLKKVASRAPVARSGIRASADEAAPSRRFEKALVAGVIALSLGSVAEAKPFDIQSAQTAQNESRPSAAEVLKGAKKDADAQFADAQRTGRETTGPQETPSGDAYPFGRQESATRGFNTTTKDEGVEGSIGSSANSDAVEARAERSANSPGTDPQNTKSENLPDTLQKVFSKGVRGAVGDSEKNEKTGEVSREGRKELAKAGKADTYVQGPQLADRIKDAFTAKTEEGKTAAGDKVEKAARATGVSTSAVELNQTATVAGLFDFGSKTDDAKSAVKGSVSTVKDAIPSSIPNPAKDANSQVSKLKNFADDQVSDFKDDVAKIKAENKARVGFPDAPELAAKTDNASGKGNAADYKY